MIRVALAVCLALIGCYTDSRGNKNLCIPGHDGLCPDGTEVDEYRYTDPVAMIDLGKPTALLREESPGVVSLFEVELASGERSEVGLGKLGYDLELMLDCDVICAAAWQGVDGLVQSAVRDAGGWKGRTLHGGGGAPPSVATSGDVVLIAWAETTTGGNAVVELRRLDQTGETVTAMTVVENVEPGGVTLTSGPMGFLLTWERSQPASPTPSRWLVAQPIGLDGIIRDAPFEVAIESESDVGMRRPFASAFFDGAFRVVNSRLPDLADWAVVDTAARTISFVAPILHGNRPRSITPLPTGALLSMGTSIVRVENDKQVEQYAVPGQLIAVRPDGYELVYRSDAASPVVSESRDLAFQRTDGPRILAEQSQPDGCAAGRGQGLALAVCAFALRRRRRRRSAMEW